MTHNKHMEADCPSWN